jgi:hypothetical protein
MPTEAGIRGELPGGNAFLIDGVTRMPGRLIVQTRFRWSPPSVTEEFVFALHSPRYRELLPSEGISHQGAQAYGFLRGGMLLEPRQPIPFSASFAEGRDGPPLPEDWFDDVELIVFRREPRGTFTREVSWDIEEWPMPGRPVRLVREGTPR